jgi:hypothetical protein
MMARILDKDTRLIDIDFGPMRVATTRAILGFNPATLSITGNGVGQLLNSIPATVANCGSFIQYSRIDLDFMVKNNEIVIPVDASIQRTSPVPLGSSINGNNFDQIEEFIYVFTRPLNNTNLGASTTGVFYDSLRDMGLDRSAALDTGATTIGTDAAGNAGWPNQAQCIYAEKRMYSYNESLGATVGNRGLDPAQPLYESIFGMPVLDSVTTWGAMEGITGPNLHAYRIVINRTQTFPALAATFKNQLLGGETQLNFPPVSIRFLCKDPDYSEGQYLTRLANAMNNIAEDGPTA